MLRCFSVEWRALRFEAQDLPTKGPSFRAEHRLIDIVDLVTFITNSYAQLGSASFKENLHSILKVQCNQLADFSTKNPTHVVPSTVSVASAILKMTELRIYRLALTDPSKRITHLVTQSNVTEFVLLNIDHLHPEPDATLRQLSLTPTTPVVACRETEFTMEVLLEMRNKRVTALPIVDGRGVMTGMMTVRHLKTLTPKTMSNLFLPITQFLSAIGATYVAGSLDMPLRDLLRVMVVNMYHHLFFLDDNGRVEGVITLSDLIRWCLAPTL
ncbi:hypothetical protein HKX48_000133 [Thoreauomyces humboldtii]|nr:hypothetical protein HKX48_000133 [Thoreauomyces humboldtii]